MNHSKVMLEKQPESRVMGLPYQGDLLSEGIRQRIREFIQELMNEELDAVLGAGHYERSQVLKWTKTA